MGINSKREEAILAGFETLASEMRQNIRTWHLVTAERIDDATGCHDLDTEIVISKTGASTLHSPGLGPMVGEPYEEHVGLTLDEAETLIGDLARIVALQRAKQEQSHRSG